MKFKTAINSDEFIKMYENLRTQYPQVNFLDNNNTFYQPKDIYIWLANRYTDRIIRYGKNEFLRYFENILLNKLPELFVAQTIYLDAMISSIKDSKTRGVVSKAFANNYSTAATYAGKAIQLTKDDNVANKGQANSESNAVDFVFDILKVINIRLEKPISNFLDGFNDLFKQFLTEQELEMIDENNDFFNNLIATLKDGENIKFDIDKINEILKISSILNKNELYTYMVNILVENETLERYFDKDNELIGYKIRPEYLFTQLEKSLKDGNGIDLKIDKDTKEIIISVNGEQTLSQKNIYNKMKLIFSTSDDFNLDFDDDKFTLRLQLAKGYVLTVDYDEFKTELAATIKDMKDNITNLNYNWVDITTQVGEYEFTKNSIRARITIEKGIIIQGIISTQIKGNTTCIFPYAKNDGKVAGSYNWNQLKPTEITGTFLDYESGKPLPVENLKITKFEVFYR